MMKARTYTAKIMDGQHRPGGIVQDHPDQVSVWDVVCDKHNFILDCDVSAGKVHDSAMFDGLFRKTFI